MMLLPCPWCGPRDATEFAHHGEVVTRPDPGVEARRWRDYLYFRDNTRGWVTETWYHRAGCRRYFTVDRDTTTNTVSWLSTESDTCDRAGETRGSAPA